MNPAQTAQRQALRVALTGLACLAVAVGMGRFAFTPVLPMMLDDGLLDLRQASALASSNYLGYLLGALACALQPWLWRRLGCTWAPSYASLIRAGLLGTIVAFLFVTGMRKALAGVLPDLSLPPAVMLQALAIMLGLGLVTGMVPALAAMRLNIVTALGRN